MRRHIAYLRYVLQHKYFVLVAGLELGVPIWLLIFHDWHKFLPSEWFAYARTFYKPDGTKQYEAGEDFQRAWNAHQKRGKHHWQYWLLTMDTGDVIPLTMPDQYRREMLADWKGAGRAITGQDNTLKWYTDNRNKMILHPDTRRWVEAQIDYRERIK